MRKNRTDDFSLHSLSPTTKVCNYCNEHKKVFETPWKITRLGLKDNSPSSTISRDKEKWEDDLVNNCTGEWSDRRVLVRSSAIIRNFERRKHTKPDLLSPTSCLKSVNTGRKNSGSEKRVNFNEEKSYRKHVDAEYRNLPSCSNSSSYYELPQYGLSKNSSSTRQESRNLEDQHRNQHRTLTVSPASSAGLEHSKRRTCIHKQFPIGNLPKETKSAAQASREIFKSRKSAPVDSTLAKVFAAKNARNCSIHQPSDSGYKRELSKGLPPKEQKNSYHQHRDYKSYNCSKSRSSGSSSRLSTIDDDLFEVIKRMSNSRYPRVNVEDSKKPRVVKPRDGLKRAALKRMLIYPPEGQIGPPLTLLKTWSNIDCQVKGNESEGFRYKVYYIQKFESEKWFPNEKTGNPFRRKEDGDCSTDYG